MKSSMKKKFLRAAAACAAVLMIGSLAGVRAEGSRRDRGAGRRARLPMKSRTLWSFSPRCGKATLRMRVFPAAGGDSEEMTMDGAGSLLCGERGGPGRLPCLPGG